jgi:hypothetical protein
MFLRLHSFPQLNDIIISSRALDRTILHPLLFLPSSSSIVLTRLSGPRQTHYFSENLVAPRIEPRSLDL